MEYVYVIKDRQSGEFLNKNSFCYEDGKLHYKTFNGWDNVDFFKSESEARTLKKHLYAIYPMGIDRISVSKIRNIDIAKLPKGSENVMVYDQSKMVEKMEI